MSDQSTPSEDVAPTEPEQAPAWLTPIQERMEELADQNYTIAQQMAALGQTSELAQPEEEPEEFDESNLYDDTGELTAEGAQAIIDRAVEERVQQALGQHFAVRDADEAIGVRDELYDDLLAREPGLVDDGPELIMELVADLRRSNQEYVVDTPLFVELIEARYRASDADESDEEEAERPSRRRVDLEEAGGGSGPTRPDEEDWSQRVLAAANRLKPNI